VGHLDKGRIWLSVNGVVKQEADLSELIWRIPDVISILSQSMRLAPGDLIYSGTPAGVGAVKTGDKLVGGVAGLTQIAIAIGDPEHGA
jgi:fumarylpyruvate hydrolase